ncbi:hypothetical protein [uncultured Gemmiger sp.]|uniref:hypothetical protein n=1 Tax=uncultured Gemmiger sp. TaxID=1623490 RepID=UPI0025CC3718|nr:hypothetical protein [uncultured Gemmiger sp.]
MLLVVMMGGSASVVSCHIHPTGDLCRAVTLLEDRVNAREKGKANGWRCRKRQTAAK